MKYRGASLLAALTIVTLAGCASRGPAVMPNVSSRQAIKLAEAAVTEGRHVEALSWYEQVLATRNVREQDRREALRGAAVLRLSSDPKLRDVARSQTLLSELTAATAARDSDRRAYEVPYMLTLVQDFTRVQAESDKRAAELGQASAASKVLNQSLDDTRKQVLDAGTTVEQSRGEIERLRTQEQTLRRELSALQDRRSALETDLAAARDEIQRKDTALRKVAATLAGLRKTP